MSRESEIATLLQADSGLTALLTGGIYPFDALTPEGITRETIPAAFDSAGVLLPLALVKQRGAVADGQVVDYEMRATSTSQIVEIWLYQNISYDTIDAAANAIYGLLQGAFLSNSFELALALVVDRQRDSGALMDASLKRLDWQVVAVGSPLGAGISL